MANPDPSRQECGEDVVLLSESSGRPFASLQKAMNWFSAFSHHCKLPCTASEGRECHVVENVPIWNVLLFHVQSELREASEGSGQLCLQGLSFTFPGLAGRRAGELWIQQRAVVSLNWLLKTHRCIGSVKQSSSNIYYYTNPSDGFFSDGFRENTSIKQLKIQFTELYKDAKLCAAISSLVQLERLECECSLAAPGALAVALGKLLCAASCLSVLKIPRLQITEDEADQLLVGLRSNKTLKELSLWECRRYGVSLINRPEFAWYLSETTTLTTLSVETTVEEGFNGPENYWLWLLEGLAANRTVSKLKLQPRMITEMSAKRIANIITESSVLRELELAPQINPFNERFTVFCNCWLEAFMDNEGLEEVRLVSSIFQLHEWELFFLAVAMKERPRKVFVSVPSFSRSSLPQFWKILRESGARRKVHIEAGCYHVGIDESHMLEYGVFTEVAAYRGQYKKPELCGTLKQMVALSHVTDFHLQIAIRDLDGPLTSAVSEYFRETATLERLHLIAIFDSLTNDLQRHSWKVLSESLLLNKSIRHFTVEAMTYPKTNDEDVHCLADTIKLSGTIHSAECNIGMKDKAVAFTRRLSEGVDQNFTLINISLPTSLEIHAPAQREWCTVLQVARRNSDFLIRAAAFVSRIRFDRRGAAALECVSRHSLLVEKVARLSSVSKVNAAAMIREAVARLRPMNEFMRLSGVVRERVVCHPREDGRPQLDDLNENCWDALRRYLTLSDIGKRRLFSLTIWELPCPGAHC